MKACLITVFAIFSIIFSTAPDTRASSDDAIRVVNLLAHLRSLNTLTFTFNQMTASELSGRSRDAHGTGTLLRTEDGVASMRWDYLQPDKQVIISDGTTLSMYFAKLNQMIISSTDALKQDITYLLFSGNADITSLFTVTRLISEQEIGKSEGLELFKLVPKSHAENVQSLLLWAGTDNTIRQIEVMDSFDTRTTLSFSNISKNGLSLSEAVSLLQFTPPKGTEIIRQ